MGSKETLQVSWIDKLKRSIRVICSLSPSLHAPSRRGCFRFSLPFVTGSVGVESIDDLEAHIYQRQGPCRCRPKPDGGILASYIK
jgi:hypothetical protein